MRDEPPRAEWTEAARAALERGDIVAMPTETVYGLAARADDPAALARLRSVKGREDVQPFTWHVGSAERLSELGAVSPYVRRIVARYWPGPLTVIVPFEPRARAANEARGPDLLASGGWIGVRCVAHQTTAAILEEVDFPVAMTSSNPHGGEPAVDADEVERAFGERVALVLDGGRARLAEASSVARIGRGKLELLREGLIDLRQLRQAGGMRIGFVCTGNTCRSPMAEELARATLAERLGCAVDGLAEFGFEVRSMGLQASNGEPAARHALDVLREAGLDLGGHRSRPLELEDLERSDKLYGMTPGHLDALRALLPEGRADVAELLDPEGMPIADPVGGPKEIYRRTAEQLRAALAVRAREWA